MRVSRRARPVTRGARRQHCPPTACPARWPLALALGLGLVAAAPATAQEEDVSVTPAATPAPPATGGWASYGVVPHSWSTMVAVTVVLPVGSSDDEEGLGGTANLLAETLAATLRSRVRKPARVVADVGRGRTVVSALVVPEQWREAYRAMEGVLFDEPVEPEVAEAVRADLLATLVFEAGTPARNFELDMHRLMAGTGAPWSRAVRGELETVESLEARDLEAFRARRYRRDRAVVTLTGALELDRAVRWVTGEAPPRVTASEDATAVHVTVDPPVPPARPAWTAGDRRRIESPVTSIWIGVAYPVDPGVSRTELEFLAHGVRAVLDRDPPPRGLFSVDVRIETLHGTPVLYVRAAVLPEASEDWEQRILRTVASVGRERESPAFFQWRRRRFRNARLLAETAPEQEGLRLGMDLLRTGAIRDIPAEIWSLGPDSLLEAVEGLGEPRIVVFGPDLSDASGG